MQAPQAGPGEFGTEPPRDGDLDALLDAVPEGWSLVEYRGRRYGLSRTSRAGGRAVSVLAHELGGSDMISANVYRVTGGSGLRPCEMPAEKVLDLLRGWSFPAGRPPGPSQPPTAEGTRVDARPDESDRPAESNRHERRTADPRPDPALGRRGAPR